MGDWLDEIIEKARERGEFDDLPGKGKPLNLDGVGPFGGADAEVYKLLKETGFTPEWVSLRKQIAESVDWLREHPGAADRQARIAAVNELIGRHNKLIPNPALAFPKVPANFAAP